jgi:hypothetical protein
MLLTFFSPTKTYEYVLMSNGKSILSKSNEAGT